MRGLIVLVLLASCFDPQATAGAPCGANGSCPTSLVCTEGYCLPPGQTMDAHDTGSDAASDAANDAAIDGASDAAMVDAGPNTWAPPAALVGVNSTVNDGDPSITANRLELYFISPRTGTLGGDDIWYSSRASVASAWSAPVDVAALSSTSTDQSVEISADGTQVWFASSRGTNLDIYTSTKAGTVWAAPTLVPELSSTTLSDTDVAIAPDGLTAIVSRGSTGSRTLSIATRATTSAAFGALTPIAAINSFATDPASPSLTNNADIIYFHADSTRNIYVTTRSGATWTTPQPVTEINTAMRDAAPFVTQTNDYMIFERQAQLFETSR